ncbi:MAG TPA: hypothetical protein DCZ69_03830 [Syntrophobacteraceae bacterium]|nr:hypothetical protein [Syntrophobacteraceae bacterium]
MPNSGQQTESSVVVQRHNIMMSIMLNRPGVLNSLNTEMIRLVQMALDEAEGDDHIGFVVLRGAGEKSFCAGGDLKMLARAAQSSQLEEAFQFFDEEYALDLRIYRFPKPVIVLADGITMGGGLGISAGADAIVATERTRMAMPESRIGIFPDVGATGWLFAKCPEGYPEFLALSGYESVGAECVRLGLATHLCPSDRLPDLLRGLEDYSESCPPERGSAARHILSHVSAFFSTEGFRDPEMDQWVRTCFHAQDSMAQITANLSACSSQREFCTAFLRQLGERSPTSLVLTLHLLRHNQGRSMAQVFAVDARAARFMVSHHDFMEGVRARILEKDDNPRWQPPRIADVDLSPELPRIFGTGL